ncbi:MAG: FecR domain-containing protein [Pseudomonadota bacterium]
MQLPSTKPAAAVTADMIATAHEWRLLLDSADVSESDKQRFSDWLAEDALHAHAFDQATTFWQALGEIKAQQLDERFLKPSGHEKWIATTDTLRQSKYRWATGIAAALVVAVVANGLLESTPVESIPSSRQQFVTAAGESMERMLSDGTTLSLGPATELTVTYTEQRRLVRLDRGQVFLDVASDPLRPLIATVGRLDARVVGTAFDVRAGTKTTSVEVAEGAVVVSYRVSTDNETDAAVGPTVLSAGSGVAASPSTGLMTPFAVDTASIGAWRDGRLIFDGTSLPEMVNDLDRYDSRSILVDDPTGALATLTVSGAFDARNIDAILATLTEILPVIIEPTEATVVIRARDDI